MEIAVTRSPQPILFARETQAMAARIVSPARMRAAPAPVPLGLPPQVPARQHLWRGASGKAYVHSVYSLIECPPLPKAGYILARRDASGRRTALHIGLGRSDAPTLNLARVRQRGAQLGANEVHVHFLPASQEARALVTFDLRAGQFGELTAEPAGTAAPSGIAI
jgi:hypothetical protein